LKNNILLSLFLKLYSLKFSRFYVLNIRLLIYNCILYIQRDSSDVRPPQAMLERSIIKRSRVLDRCIAATSIQRVHKNNLLLRTTRF